MRVAIGPRYAYVRKTRPVTASRHRTADVGWGAQLLAGGPAPVPEGTLVAGAAHAAGARADAYVAPRAVEHIRRTAAGAASVTCLGLLDALMCLPLGADVPAADLEPDALARLRAGPPGCVDWAPDRTWVRRLADPPADVTLVIVAAPGLTAGLKRAAAFTPFAPRVVLLGRLPRSFRDRAWEADAAGVGVWTRQPDGALVEHVPADPFQAPLFKPAGWRFRERAYAAWVNVCLS